MKGRINSELGDINISEEAIATCAGAAAVECFGVVGMAAISMKDGLARLLKGESLDKGIHVEITDNEISVKLHIIVAYGVSISAVCDNLISDVKYKIEEFTGLKVRSVGVFVEGVKPID